MDQNRLYLFPFESDLMLGNEQQILWEYLAFWSNITFNNKKTWLFYSLYQNMIMKMISVFWNTIFKMLYLLRMEANMSFQIFPYCLVHGLEFRIFPLRPVVTQDKRSYSPYYLVGKRDGSKFFSKSIYVKVNAT